MNELVESCTTLDTSATLLQPLGAGVTAARKGHGRTAAAEAGVRSSGGSGSRSDDNGTEATSVWAAAVQSADGVLSPPSGLRCAHARCCWGVHCV